jgi:metallo-beta-lactamase class B
MPRARHRLPGWHGRQSGLLSSEPGIGDDYRHTFHISKSLRPDIWLTPHNEVWDSPGKRARFAKEGARAWVDPEGYRLFVAGQREKFEEAVNKEMGVPRRDEMTSDKID